MKLNVSTLPQPRQHLAADGLFATLRARFGKFTDARTDPAIPLEDALLSGLAVFALKDPSLLAFEERRSQRNLRALFGIERAPSDTQMREILDPLDPEQLREAFQDVFRALQRGKALEPLVFHDGAYLLALDGTGYSLPLKSIVHRAWKR